MQDAGSDKATAALTGAGSQDATNTVAAPPPFTAPGSVSAGSYRTPVTPELPVIPAQAGKGVAGPGDRGGTISGAGTAPGAGWGWASLDREPDGDPDWTRDVAGTPNPSGH